MTAVGLACLSAFLFGGMSVGLRMGLNRYPDVELATVATVVGALAVSLVPTAGGAPSRGVHAAAAWPFLLAGLMQPGVGQFFVTLAIREAGASRASVVLGSAPLASVTIALIFLGEPVSWPLDPRSGPDRRRRRRAGARAWAGPAHVLRRGYVFAFLATILFSARDNLTRWLAGTTRRFRPASPPRRRSPAACC